jgi:hypothetical protein
VFAFSETLPPEQKDVAPPATTLAEGCAETLTESAEEIAVQPVLETVTV